MLTVAFALIDVDTDKREKIKKNRTEKNEKLK